MLTRNFLQMLGGSSGMGAENSDKATVKTIDGSASGLVLGINGSTPFSSSGWPNSKFIIGTGTTKPKITDINLESEIKEGYDCSALGKRYIIGDEKDYIKIYGTITNTGTDSLSFNEVGWLIMYSSKYHLVAREVYDTPITIAPGESVAVNVNIM